MADCEYKPTRRATAERLTVGYTELAKRAPFEGAVYIVGRTTFVYEMGEWFREVRTKAKRPEFRTGTLYGGFAVPKTGHNFVLWKVAGSVNWHKVIVPAFRRLVRQITGQSSTKTGWWVDGLGDGEFDRLRGPAKYEFRDGEFVLTHPGRKAK